jgi:hypothetical protein
MKKNINFLILLTTIFICTSCRKSLLESSQPGNILPLEEYVVDLRSSQEYLNGIYIQATSSLYQGTVVVYPEIIADNIKPTSGGTSLANQYAWKQQADDQVNSSGAASTYNINGLYGSGYKIASSSSFLLTKAELLRKEDEAKANNILGQAYVFRALGHLNIVNAFAQPYNFTQGGKHLGIPYSTTNDWKTVSANRLSVAEVYDNIISDLKKGIQLLPNGPVSAYVINKYTAMALLARVYLAKESFTEARSYARRVIELVPLMKVNYPDSLFTPHDTEALFQLVPSENNGYNVTFASYYFRSVINFLATQDIVKILQENQGDSRKKWIQKTGSNWNIVKFPMNAIGGFKAPAKAYYHDVIRSSEMYLIAAESYARNATDRKEDSARYFLNAIRQRANPSAISITAAGSDLVDSIYKERRKELAFEGYRMYDLLRWKKGVVRSDPTNVAYKELPYPSNFAIAPIPRRDVDIVGTQQNDGYK